MDASGYTSDDIDQARQSTAHKIIDGLEKFGSDFSKELKLFDRNLKAGFDAGMYPI